MLAPDYCPRHAKARYVTTLRGGKRRGSLGLEYMFSHFTFYKRNKRTITVKFLFN